MRDYREFLASESAISMRSLEVYMTMFFLLFLFLFFILVVTQVRMSDIKSQSSLSAHELAFEIADRVSSTEYLVVTETGGQKKTAVFDPLKLSTADYESLRNYLQLTGADWEIEIYDLEATGDGTTSLVDEMNNAYMIWSEKLAEKTEEYKSIEDGYLQQLEAGTITRKEFKQLLKELSYQKARELNEIEKELIENLREAKAKYDCSPDKIKWNTDSGDSPECSCSGATPCCLFDRDPSVWKTNTAGDFNINCLKCGYWRIGPNLDFQAKTIGDFGPSLDPIEYIQLLRLKNKIRRRVVYEFPCAISYYCDARGTSERKKPIHLGVLRVSVIEWDYNI